MPDRRTSTRGGGREEELPTVRNCGTERVHLRLLLEDPDYARRRAAIENHAWRAARMQGELRSGCTRIPVVVHVVYRTDVENISKEQVDSQIEVLNQDFRRTNGDIGSVPAAFQPLTADARVEFELASSDPNGAATDGITRTQTTVNGFTDDDAVKSAGTGGADAWPSDRYLNIWVCRLAGGLLGYAQFPGGPAATDGVVITHTGFGNTGTAAAPFNLGRTTTHEVGHWLDLRHIWGDDAGGCSGSDFVADTPNQAGPNFGTPAFPTISCSNGPNGDMFMNYMDYTDDAAMFMFSAGQVTRMQAALDGARSSIGTAIPCGPKLKFTDEPPTLKFRDDPLTTLKFRDDPIATLKFRDDPITTLKFFDDPIPTLKFRDDVGTLKAVDDPIGTIKAFDDPIGTIKAFDDPIGTIKAVDDPGTSKLIDDPIGTSKAIDDVKLPALDEPGLEDPLGPVVNPVAPGVGRAPFVLATPHHSDAWQRAAGGQAAIDLAAYEQRLGEYEMALREYATAEQGGALSGQERAEAEAIYAEYVQLGSEYQRLRGGGM